MVPVIVRALGNVTHNFQKFMEQLGIELEIHFVQKSTFIRDSQDIEEGIGILSSE